MMIPYSKQGKKGIKNCLRFIVFVYNNDSKQ